MFSRFLSLLLPSLVIVTRHILVLLWFSVCQLADQHLLLCLPNWAVAYPVFCYRLFISLATLFLLPC